MTLTLVLLFGGQGLPRLIRQARQNPGNWFRDRVEGQAKERRVMIAYGFYTEVAFWDLVMLPGVIEIGSNDRRTVV